MQPLPPFLLWWGDTICLCAARLAKAKFLFNDEALKLLVIYFELDPIDFEIFKDNPRVDADMAAF